MYDDPTLDTLIRSALERNADIRITVARIEETYFGQPCRTNSSKYLF
jgi:hypothetical protein